MEDYEHLLLIRFNLDYSFYSGDEYICDEEWHEERFDLFKRFCLASIARQTTTKFKLLIFFNDDVRDKYQNFIEETKKLFPEIRFIFVKPEEDHRVLLHEYIEEHIKSTYLITTRMDNDDAIAEHFIESVQNAFKSRWQSVESDFFIINAGNGYQFEMKFPYRKTVIDNYKYSPFISLASKVNESNSFKIILENSHLKWENITDAVELNDSRYWIQIVHTKNQANQILSLNLLPNIEDKNFSLMNSLSKNRYWSGIVMLPLQFGMTLAKRMAVKFKKMWN